MEAGITAIVHVLELQSRHTYLWPQQHVPESQMHLDMLSLGGVLASMAMQQSKGIMSVVCKGQLISTLAAFISLICMMKGR